MSDTTLWVKDQVHKRLYRAKEPKESFNDFIGRLLDEFEVSQQREDKIKSLQLKVGRLEERLDSLPDEVLEEAESRRKMKGCVTES